MEMRRRSSGRWPSARSGADFGSSALPRLRLEAHLVAVRPGAPRVTGEVEGVRGVARIVAGGAAAGFDARALAGAVVGGVLALAVGGGARRPVCLHRPARPGGGGIRLEGVDL